MKEKTKSYTAGLMDAEGCIRLAKTAKSGKVHYSPRVYVSNQSRVLMKWLVQHFGGQFVRNVNSSAGLDWYLWYLQSRPATESFLRSVVPYLKLKKPQAECLIGFCSAYQQEDEADREKRFQTLKELKIIGSVTTETHSSYLKAEQSYIAGYFDGEGCISIDKSPRENTTSYRLYVRIANTDLLMLELCRSIYGGSIRKKSGRCYDWALHGKPNVEKFLLATLPYLVVKRDEAKSALEYVQLGAHAHCPQDRDRLYSELRRLKKLKIQSELRGDAQGDGSGSYQSTNT